MTDGSLLDQVLQLPEPERRALIEAASATLTDPLDLTPELQELLDERVRDANERPGAFVPWEQLRTELRQV